MNTDQLVHSWSKGIRISHVAHNRAATHYGRLHRLLGVPVVILSTVVGTAVFASYETDPDPMIRIVIGLLSVSAAVMSALQTFLGYPELAEKHKTSASFYGELRRDLEYVLAFKKDDPEIETFLKDWKRRWDEADHKAPQVPERIIGKTIKEVIDRLDQKREQAIGEGDDV